MGVVLVVKNPLQILFGRKTNAGGFSMPGANDMEEYEKASHQLKTYVIDSSP